MIPDGTFTQLSGRNLSGFKFALPHTMMFDQASSQNEHIVGLRMEALPVDCGRNVGVWRSLGVRIFPIEYLPCEPRCLTDANISNQQLRLL